LSEEPLIDKTTKKINDLFNTVINIQKDCESKMKEIQLVLTGLKKLRQGTAQNIFGEKLSKTEVTDLIAKIVTKLKSLNVN